MYNFIPFASLFAAFLVLTFFRLSRLPSSALLAAAALGAYGLGASFGHAHWLVNASIWTLLGATLVVLNIGALRKSLVTKPFLRFYERIAPALSESEQVALAAGTVGFEGELFSGMPDWRKLLSQPIPKLNAEEQAFIDGPCEEVCKLTNDWEVTHERADLDRKSVV